MAGDASAVGAAGFDDGAVTRGWFPTAAGPVFAALHLPADGRARAAVLLCPSVGQEQTTAHTTLRLAAESLAERGLAALRIDWPGSGDSADPDPFTVQTWVQAVVDAVDLLRGAGAERVALVGMRLGALLTCAASAETGPTAASVLWDPVRSGRVFLREQMMLAQAAAASEPGGPPGTVQGPNMVFPPELAAGIQGLPRLTSSVVLGAGDRPVLVLARPESVGEWEDAAGSHGCVDVVEAREQADLLSVETLTARVPRQDVARLVDWLDAQLPGPAVPMTSALSTEVTIPTARGSVRERVETVGQGRLFCIRSMPDTSDGPAVVFANTATTYHGGPGRMWVLLGRRWAEKGRTCVRFDNRDLGESPEALDPEAPRFYSPHTVQDLAEVVGACASAGRGVVVVGLCSGAWTAMGCAQQVSLDAVLSVNQIIFTDTIGPVGPMIGVRAPGRRRLFEALERRPRAARLLEAAWPVLTSGRDVLSRTLATVIPARSHESTIRRVLARGTGMTLILLGEEWPVFRRHIGYGRLRRLERLDGLEIVILDVHDHAMLGGRARSITADSLTRALLGRSPLPP